MDGQSSPQKGKDGPGSFPADLNGARSLSTQGPWADFSMLEAAIHRSFYLRLVRYPHSVVSLQGELRDDCDLIKFEIDTWADQPREWR